MSDFFETAQAALSVGLIAVIAVVLLFLIMLARMYRKAKQGEALVKTGVGGIKVSFNGMVVFPVIHRLEVMDISLKTITIERLGKDGLVCKDNMRADIKVAFFVRVNENEDAVKKVAKSVGCERASDEEALRQLFEAKFSEALKNVGKQLDFVDLYNKREEFRREIVANIGTDLNGYILDDAAIDYLEQTKLEALDPENILDSEGIKKIIDITSKQNVEANLIKRDQEKVITQQDVEAKEAILELKKQLAETEERQKREIANIKAREEAETAKVQEEERLKSEAARIATEEELEIAVQNKERQVIVAEKNKERTAAIEHEKVEKDRLLEVTERERIVSLAQIEKEKAIEEEQKNIQEVIRERVSIEKTVVEEQEKIKDTEAFAQAEREKAVAIKKAEEKAEEALVQTIKNAEAQKQAAEHIAKQKIIDAEADQASAAQKAEAIKILADAEASKQAAVGLSEAQVMEAKAAAKEKQGEAEASVIEAQALAEAKGIEARKEAEAKGIEATSEAQAAADLQIGRSAAQVEKEKGIAEANVIEAKATAEEQKGLVEAKVLHEKLSAEAKGITEKAEAMKQLDGVGKEHEEFKLQLEKEKEIELAQIGIQKDIAQAQADILSSALKSANIDIVGGEQEFFDRIIATVTQAKTVDKLVNSSEVVTELKDHFFSTDEGKNVIEKIKGIIQQVGLNTEDIKNLSVSALLYQLLSKTSDEEQKGFLNQALNMVKETGIANNLVSKFL